MTTLPHCSVLKEGLEVKEGVGDLEEPMQPSWYEPVIVGMHTPKGAANTPLPACDVVLMEQSLSVDTTATGRPESVEKEP